MNLDKDHELISMSHNASAYVEIIKYALDQPPVLSCIVKMLLKNRKKSQKELKIRYNQS